jgi:thiol-disulfide isomerase/thioredoxin
VLAAITVLSAEHRFSLDSVLLTFAYSLGAAGPMLLVALGGQRAAKRLRAGGDNLRGAMGVVVALTAVAIVFNTAQSLQTALGGYSSTLQKSIEDTTLATKRLDALRGGGNAFAPPAKQTGARLPVLGTAPEFAGISHWLNTPGEQPLTLASLRGKVVLIDFWTYSCINCIRTLPHLRAWYAAYHRRGFEIVGVHTPEFAFEHVLSNVRSASRRLGVTWPVALDNDYKTWNSYSNQYWPAEYLIGKQGHVREIHFGEGKYGTTEASIRALLAETGASLPRRTAAVANATLTELTTPESYLGYLRLTRYSGLPIRANVVAEYAFPPSLPRNLLSYAGRWRIGPERAVAGTNARLRLHFVARDVYLVLGGKGRVESYLDGNEAGSIRVDADRLYTIVSARSARDALLELRVSPGVNAYAFTFG